MGERKWISRDEIADIYEERGKQACLSGGPGGNTDEAHRQWKKADLYRSIDRLDNPIGNRS